VELDDDVVDAIGRAQVEEIFQIDAHGRVGVHRPPILEADRLRPQAAATQREE